ncbi:MAG: sulfotransferase [Myxococcota bacterium]
MRRNPYSVIIRPPGLPCTPAAGRRRPAGSRGPTPRRTPWTGPIACAPPCAPAPRPPRPAPPRAVSRPARTAPVATDDSAAPIIVAGCHRPAPLLRRILDSHTRIACPAELQLFEALATVLDRPNAEAGLAAVDVDLDTAAADLGARPTAGCPTTPAARQPAGPRSPPTTSPSCRPIDRMFGHRARFLLVARDGADVAWSLGKGRWEVLGRHLQDHDDPYLAAAHFWVERNRALLAFRAAVPDRTHVLRYEQLVVDPEATLRRAFAFLGEAWEPDVLDFNRFDHGSGIEDHVVSSTWRIEDGRGRHKQLPEALQAELRAVVDPVLRELDAVS